MFFVQFFMKATQLEQMKEDYSYIMETKALTQNTLEKHEVVSSSVKEQICVNT